MKPYYEKLPRYVLAMLLMYLYHNANPSLIQYTHTMMNSKCFSNTYQPHVSWMMQQTKYRLRGAAEIFFPW